MVPAVDDEASRPGDVHPLVQRRPAIDLAHRQQKIGAKDQKRAGPADDLDQDLFGAQAASLRST